MSDWLKRSLLIVGVFVVVWVLVISSWVVTKRMPNSAEVVGYFIVVPLALLVVFWLGKTVRKRMAAAQIAPPAAASVGGAAPSLTDRTAERERYASLAILTASVRTAQGNSAEELAGNLKQGALVDLDAELIDNQGYPLFAARCPDVDVDALRMALSDFAESLGRPALSWSESDLRGLAIGRAVAEELASFVTSHAQLDAYLLAQSEGQSRAAKLGPVLPMLRILLDLPDNLDAAQRVFAGEWFCDLICRQGWPREHLLLVSHAASSSASALASSNAAATAAVSLLADIDRLLVDAVRNEVPCLAIAMACQSYLVSINAPADNDTSWSWINRNAQVAPCITVLASKLDFDSLFGHLKQFTEMKLPDDDEMFFAFWDPAILGALVGQPDDNTLYVRGPIFNEEEFYTFTHNIEGWWYWDRDGITRSINVQKSAPELALVPTPYKLTQKQVDDLVEASLPDHVLYYIELNQAQLIDEIPPAKRYQFVADKLALARDYGLEAMSDLVNFACAALIYKERLQEDLGIAELLNQVKQKEQTLAQALEKMP